MKRKIEKKSETDTETVINMMKRRKIWHGIKINVERTSKQAYKSRSTICCGAARRTSRVKPIQVPASLTIRRVNVLIFRLFAFEIVFLFLFVSWLARAADTFRNKLSPTLIIGKSAHLCNPAITKRPPIRQWSQSLLLQCVRIGISCLNSKFRFHCLHTNAFTHTRATMAIVSSCRDAKSILVLQNIHNVCTAHDVRSVSELLIAHCVL